MNFEKGKNERREAGHTLYYFGLIFKCPLKTFEKTRSYLLTFNDAIIVYQTKTLTGFLKIVKVVENTQ